MGSVTAGWDGDVFTITLNGKILTYKFNFGKDINKDGVLCNIFWIDGPGLYGAVLKTHSFDAAKTEAVNLIEQHLRYKADLYAKMANALEGENHEKGS